MVKAEIERIRAAVASALSAIAAHGVDVPEGSTVDDLAGLIASIKYSVTVSDDGAGNVTLAMSATVSDDGAGNVDIS